MRQAVLGALSAVILIAAGASANAPQAPADAAPRAVGDPPTPTLYLYFGATAVAPILDHGGCTLVGVVEAHDNGVFEAKQIKGVQQERCKVTLSFAMSRTLKQWLRYEVEGRDSAREMSILRMGGDAGDKPVAAVTMDDASLTGFTIPEAHIANTRLTMEIELTALVSRKAELSEFTPPPAFTNPALVHGSQRLAVDGGATSALLVSRLGLERQVEAAVFGPWIIKDLTFLSARAKTATIWDTWYDANVVQMQDDRRQVTLEYLKPNGSTVGATFTLGGVGVIAGDGNLSDPKVSTGREFRAFVETLDLQIN